MQALLYLLPCVALVLGCGVQDLGMSTYKAMEPCDDHYPLGTFPSEYDDMEDVVRELYGTPLKAMHAPCLRNFDVPGIKVLRFTWMPSFDPSIVVTILTDGDRCVAHGASVQWKMETFIPYTVKDVVVGEAVEVAVPDDRCDLILSTLERTDFWEMRTIDPEPRGHDGAQWILEANDAGKYHVTDRWDPPADYRALFRLALESSGLYTDRFDRY